MIRRRLAVPSAQPLSRSSAPAGLADRRDAWILISQIDHAHLAGRLAEHWGAGGFAPLEPREAVLWAIIHHDDGWQGWDELGSVEPRDGKPRSFTEMELGDALRIWTASIDTAAEAGNLQAYVVAGHFCALAQRSAAWRRDDPLWPRAEEFLARQGALMDRWLRTWQSEDPANNSCERARTALAQLQFFDALSLWFCCESVVEPERVDTPGGGVLTLTPLDETHILVSPWPLGVGSLNLEVPGRAISNRPCVSRQELAAAASQPVRIAWQVQPHRENVDPAI